MVSPPIGYPPIGDRVASPGNLGTRTNLTCAPVGVFRARDYVVLRFTLRLVRIRYRACPVV